MLLPGSEIPEGLRWIDSRLSRRNLEPSLNTSLTALAAFDIRLLLGRLASLSVTLIGLQSAVADTVDADFGKLHAGAQKAFKERVEPFINRYCAECHGLRRMKGGLNFAPALKKPGNAAFVKYWQQAFVSVDTHDMPPEEADHLPTDEERKKFQEGLGQMKYLSEKDPGAFVIRRLTKAEYGNTLHDLFGVDASIAAELPDEVPGEGYLNSLSPLQSEQYLGIANEVLKRLSAAKQKQLFGESPTEVRVVAQAVARSAYRRPITAAEEAVLLRVYDLGKKNKLDHPAALRLMIKAVLVSPQFLFITSAKPATPGQSITPLDDHQLASRLSYFLWATMPDAELTNLADEGKLHEPAELKGQVKRLLADPRSRALFDGFGAQWLGLVELSHKTFDLAKFPQMNGELRKAMREEARLFFDSIVRENRSVVDFVQSDYTFLNDTLAKLYGMESSVTGPEMRRVKLSNPNRGGILGMPAVLATTSFPNRTSPVNRGVWVLEQVLGELVPPAPPNVPALEKQDKKRIANLTLRQRTELHRTNAVCANCHKILDPIGFGLENFDAIGRWRDKDDTGGAIDAAGELPGGKRFTSPKELKSLIAARSNDLGRNLTEKLLAYALGRKLEGYDEIVVDRLMQTIAQDGYRMQTIVSEIVMSYPFVNRRVK